MTMTHERAPCLHRNDSDRFNEWLVSHDCYASLPYMSTYKHPRLPLLHVPEVKEYRKESNDEKTNRKRRAEEAIEKQRKLEREEANKRAKTAEEEEEKKRQESPGPSRSFLFKSKPKGQSKSNNRYRAPR